MHQNAIVQKMVMMAKKNAMEVSVLIKKKMQKVQMEKHVIAQKNKSLHQCVLWKNAESVKALIVIIFQNLQ